jgi:hypothetical protein
MSRFSETDREKKQIIWTNLAKQIRDSFDDLFGKDEVGFSMLIFEAQRDSDVVHIGSPKDSARQQLRAMQAIVGEMQKESSIIVVPGNGRIR